jgi:hypothetical protein
MLNGASAPDRLVQSVHRVEPDFAQRRNGTDTSVLDWRSRLVCSECGWREADILVTGTGRRGARGSFSSASRALSVPRLEREDHNQRMATSGSREKSPLRDQHDGT